MTSHDHLDLRVPAGPGQVGALRRSLRRWLAGVLAEHVDAVPTVDAGELEDAADDLVLATSEALENVVDHAFTGSDRPGTMTFSAHVEDGSVVVTVADDGRWREPRTGPTTRGRGFTLMETLADTVVEHRADGTTVTLRRRLPTALDRSPGDVVRP